MSRKEKKEKRVVSEESFFYIYEEVSFFLY